MKRKVLLASCIALVLMGQSVQAGDAARSGLINGAMGGALIGQIIGRDTRSTLLGTAIGGVIGYMAGNEADQEVRHPGPTYSYSHQPQSVWYPQPPVPQQVIVQTVIVDNGRYAPRMDSYHRGRGRMVDEYWRQRTAYHPSCYQPETVIIYR